MCQYINIQRTALNKRSDEAKDATTNLQAMYCVAASLNFRHFTSRLLEYDKGAIDASFFQFVTQKLLGRAFYFRHSYVLACAQFCIFCTNYLDNSTFKSFVLDEAYVSYKVICHVGLIPTYLVKSLACGGDEKTPFCISNAMLSHFSN